MSLNKILSVSDPLDPSHSTSRRQRLKRSGILTQAKTGEPRTWDAEVIKIERCTSVEYLTNEWRKVFEYTPLQKDKRSYLRGTGGKDDLALTLYTIAEDKKTGPDTLQTFPFPVPDAKLSIRLYDANALIEIFTDPNKKPGVDAEGDYWAIFLRGDNNQERMNVVNMLRHLEGLVRTMPDEWFSCRNFFTVPGEATDAIIPPPPTADGQYTHEMAGGVSLFLTGNLATKEALELFGHRNFRQTAQETRSMTKPVPKGRPGAYKTSSIAPALRPGQKKSERLAKLEVQREKREQRMQVSRVQRDSSPLRVVFPPVVIRPQQGFQAHQSEGQRQATSDDSSMRSSVTLSGDHGDTAKSPDEGSIDPEEYPIEGILKDDVDDDGNSIYLIKWKSNEETGEGYDDTWEPEDNVSADALAVYRLGKEKSSSKKRKTKGRPARSSKKSKK
ncbi:MAG: hypothetical protein L6R38_002589 [Xanthoria sp. 2 TBL-2021]|nr:MAG: hypothetical protein L6R38_002589 [Xanthoria sp. 2 TBL-2021]